VPEPVRSHRANLVGGVAFERRLDVSIQLPLRNEAELDALIARLYDPTSPDYRHFLSVDEFSARFGPTAEDVQKVADYAHLHGLEVTDRPRNRMLVAVAGPAGAVQTAFHVSLAEYQHPTEARTFYAPDTEPTIDVDVTVLHIAGLDNYATRISMMKRHADLMQANTTGSGPGGAFLASDFRKAYGGGTSLTGAGQTVGLIEFGPYNVSDVQTYFNSINQALNVPISNVLLDGVSGTCGSGCDDGEEALDIEQTIGMAPGLSRVIVYEGNNDVHVFNQMAADNIAKQGSCSFGWLPADPGSDQPIFKEFAAQGQNMFIASGDSGAISSSNQEFYPGDDPFITSVGGTSLTTNGAGGSWSSESAWVGSQGGVTTNGFALPSYQSGVATSANHGSTTLRNVPDVASNANTNMYFCANGSCGGGIGGTSAAAPQWAGFLALVNQQAVANGKPTLGFLNPTIYSIGKGASYATNLHDVATGNNFNSSSPSLYSATTGYDLVTGWGAPNGPALITTLAGGGAPTPTSTATKTATPTATRTPTATPTGSAGTGTVVNLSGAFNLNGIYTDGTTFTTGGIDGTGSAYSGNLLGSSLTWLGTSFSFGPANQLNAVRNKTVTLPSGSFVTLRLLAAGINGNQVSQTFKVNYTDGSSSTFTQSVSDWFSPQGYAGESTAKAMPYRDTSSGTTDNRTFNLYGYSFALSSGKTVSSLVLPANNNVVLLAATVVSSGGTATPTSTAVATGTATKTATATATRTATPTPTSGTGGICNGVPAWTDCCGCTYTLGQQVTYGSPASLYKAAQTFTNTCGAGWTPNAVSSLWTPVGGC
jgi:subtilase family serine protease